MKCYVNERVIQEADISEKASDLLFVPSLHLKMQFKSFFLGICYDKFGTTNALNYNMQFFFAVR